ncbi:EamA family transporter [Romboutsia weinsteinii]|uniref:EamA family transporter n=1 Tax=Romboutsia weinsteinii TaxID=2020949 RepID=A0A371J9P4_9FIRM|nr:DMT family transporter [Romboutsia weinsteinii]RDY29481.1 EamA family transporter [Romboutsia weinsteinii]
MNEIKKGYVSIFIAGLAWSTIGLFGNTIMSAGVAPEQVAFIRLFLGCLVLVIYCGIKNRELLSISKKGIMYSIIIGILCQAAFNLFYFNAINKLGVSMAAVLLYTSPLFLAIFSRLIYKEELTKNKIVSLVVCFIGALLAVTGGKLELTGISILGLTIGVLSAITYALMPIISKTALKENSSITILIYGFLFGAIVMIPSAKPLEILAYVGDMKLLGAMIMLGVLPSALAYIFYTGGISKGVELSVVGIVASVELVVSVIIGWTIIGEDFSIIKLLGVLLMVASTVIVLRGNNDEHNYIERNSKVEIV